MTSAYPPPLPPGDPPVPPVFTLFDSRTVAMATFFGSPLAGSILLGINYRRLGNRGAAGAALGIGVVLTSLLLVLGYVLPGNAGYGLSIGAVVAASYGAKALQGAAIEQHVRSGGKLGSRWTAFGIAIATLVLLFAGIFLVVYAQTPKTKVTIGAKDEVFYSGSATEQDARSLGLALQSMGYLRDSGSSVALAKDRKGYMVSFVIREGAWDNPETVTGFEAVGRQIAPAVGGLPLRLRLMDSSFEVKKEMTVN